MARIVPDIPIKFTGVFPPGFQNTLPYWGFFSKEEIEANGGSLMMMDVDFARYCSLDCPSCFRKSNVIDDIEDGDLSYDELIRVIDEARELNLKSLKICGAGEPTENSRFLRFAREMTDRGIGLAVFTKGQVLGSDDQARRFFKREGIASARQLCDELHKLKVSVMLSFQSYHTEIQDALVGKEGHTLVRNRALFNLVEAGFNDSNPTRLALCNAPITNTSYPEVFEIYVWARERNLYPVSAASMVSGKQLDREFLRTYDPSPEQKIELWTRIYRWNLEHGLQTIDSIRSEGISVMPGIHPCNQVACGLYVTANGNVVGCPGFTEVEGNIRSESIKDIWDRSRNRTVRSGRFNCHCPPKDGITIPSDLYDQVLINLQDGSLH